MRNSIDFAALFVCSVYSTIPLFWFVVHPFIDRWRKRGRRGYHAILPIWAAFIAAVFAVMWPFRSVRLYESWLAWMPGLMFFALGFSIYAAAFKGFGRVEFSGLAELEPGKHRQELIVTGIRSRIRHPIYLAHFCEVIGWCIGTGLIALYALAAFAVLTGAIMLRMEDRELEMRFGESFRRYRSAVPAVIPRILG